MLDAGNEALARAGADAAGPLLTVERVSPRRFAIRNAGWFAGKPAGGGGASPSTTSASSIRRGECLGLVGESGCGKTTLSKILMRALTPDAGTIRFNDRGSLVDVLALEGDDLIKPSARACSSSSRTRSAR